jgi:trehalose 6-phosphate synthase/phosphatase
VLVSLGFFGPLSGRSLTTVIVLWPTFHYIIPQTFPLAEGASLVEKDWWRDYLRFNNAYADEIMRIYTPGDIVWIHDYHLLMLPEILRQRIGRNVHIGLFVHAPWPSSEIFRILNRRKQLLSGMLASNMIGFQSVTYKEHFVSCCKRVLGFGESTNAEGVVTGVETHGAHCAVHALPIGIDYQKVSSAVNHPGVEHIMTRITNGYEGRKIIVGRDRLDSVRGVLQKLRAFERFLEDHPEWIDKVRIPTTRYRAIADGHVGRFDTDNIAVFTCRIPSRREQIV